MKWLDRKIDDFIRRIRDNPQTLADQARWLAGEKNAPNRRIIPVGSGGALNPTYWRYFVWRRNPVFNCYLHDFRRDDEQDPHTHRMMNISFICTRPGYFEERFAFKPVAGFPLPHTERTFVPPHRLFFRLPHTPHRVVLKRDTYDKPIPIWSLFIGFPQFFNWGFWCPGGGKAKFVPQEVYLAPDAGGGTPEYNYSRPVRGCGD